LMVKMFDGLIVCRVTRRSNANPQPET